MKDLVDIFDDKKIFDYTFGIDVPTQSTNTRMNKSQTLMTFVRQNTNIIISGITTYFLTDAIHVGRKMRIDSTNIRQIIAMRSEDKDLDLAAFRYRVYITPKGILHFFYNNISKIQIHNMAFHATLFFKILEYIFVRTSLLAYINTTRQGLVFISPHSYKIQYSIKDILERYGSITKQTFNKKVVEHCQQYKRIMDKRNSKIDTSRKKDIFEIDV